MRSTVLGHPEVPSTQHSKTYESTLHVALYRACLSCARLAALEQQREARAREARAREAQDRDAALRDAVTLARNDALIQLHSLEMTQ